MVLLNGSSMTSRNWDAAAAGESTSAGAARPSRLASSRRRERIIGHLSGRGGGRDGRRLDATGGGGGRHDASESGSAARPDPEAWDGWTTKPERAESAGR